MQGRIIPQWKPKLICKLAEMRRESNAEQLIWDALRPIAMDCYEQFSKERELRREYFAQIAKEFATARANLRDKVFFFISYKLLYFFSI